MNDIQKKLTMMRFISTYCQRCSNEACSFLLQIKKENSRVEIKGYDVFVFGNNKVLRDTFEFRKDILSATEPISCFQENKV